MTEHPCPRCGTALAVPPTGDDLSCGCGFTAYAPYVREAAHLRDAIPAWQARLDQLEAAIASSVRPDITAAAPLASRGVGAQQVLLAVGAVLLIAGAAAFTAVTWQLLGRGGQTAVLAALVVLTGVITLLLRRRIPATATTLAIVTLGILLFADGWAIQTFSDGAWWRLDTLALTAFTGGTAAVTLAAGRLAGIAVWRVSGVVLIPITAGLALAWVTTSLGATLPASIPTLIGALPLLAAGLLILQGRIRISPEWQRLLIAILLLAISGGFVLASPWAEQSTWLTWSLAFLMIAALSWSSPATRSAACVIVGVALGVAAGIAWPSVWFSTVLVIVVIGVGVLVPVPVLRGAFAPITSLVAGALWLPVTIGWHWSGDLRLPITAVLVAGSGCLLLTSWRPQTLWRLIVSAGLAVPALAIIISIITEQTPLNDYQLETYTIPIAVAVLGYGLIVHRWYPRLTSAAWLLPAVTIALLPSTFASLSDILQARFYACVGIAIVMLLVGAFSRLIGLLAPAAVSVVILAVQPIGYLAQVVPPWILYTIGGLLLVVIGARFEQVRQGTRQASRWMQGHLR